MFQTLKLFLPALVPSWRFFDGVAPSPRIEFTLLKSAEDVSENWQEFYPRPAHLSFFNMLKRMIWNPHWNETLFLVSCAERLVDNPTDHSEQEIFKRIKAGLRQGLVDVEAMSYLQFRLVFISRQGEQLEKQITYISPVHSLHGGGGQ